MSAGISEHKGKGALSKGALMAQEAAELSQYLTFMLGGEVYAIGILSIKEIIEFGGITEVPMMPAFIRGVINLRGRVVPVVDLSARFGRGNAQIARRTCIVIVEVSDPEIADVLDIGIMVDAVNEVVEINAGDIEPPPSFGVRIRPEFIQGMARREKGFTILLDVNCVLSVDEMTELGRSCLEVAKPAIHAESSDHKGSGEAHHE